MHYWEVKIYDYSAPLLYLNYLKPELMSLFMTEVLHLIAHRVKTSMLGLLPMR
jgi:hypothetical protein